MHIYINFLSNSDEFGGRTMVFLDFLVSQLTTIEILYVDTLSICDNHELFFYNIVRFAKSCHEFTVDINSGKNVHYLNIWPDVLSGFGSFYPSIWMISKMSACHMNNLISNNQLWRNIKKNVHAVFAEKLNQNASSNVYPPKWNDQTRKDVKLFFSVSNNSMTLSSNISFIFLMFSSVK